MSNPSTHIHDAALALPDDERADLAYKLLQSLIDLQGTQAIKLPDEYRFDGDRVSIRKQGDAVILEPIKPANWPDGFFADIHIDDPAFSRPEQGQTPPAPSLS